VPYASTSVTPGANSVASYRMLDWKIPEDLMGNSRFGIKEYADPVLLDTSRHSSRTARFAEILEDWKDEYFDAKNPLEYWEGTAFQLQKEFLKDPTSEAAVRHLGVDAIGRHLTSLKQKTVGIEVVVGGNTRKWKIFPDNPKQEN
jgi:hypothetical protein